MLTISHRGNLHGPSPYYENKPEYIFEALMRGFDVEIDLWVINEECWLGHYKPQYVIHIDKLANNKEKLWIHCKNKAALIFFSKFDSFNYFFHIQDEYTLTSKKYIWAHPMATNFEGTIHVMPEKTFGINFIECLDLSLVGVCTDFANLISPRSPG